MNRSKKRTRGPRLLGEFTPRALSSVAAKLGFGESDIALHWKDVAGERLAEVSEPQRLRWPVPPANRQPDVNPEPAVLVLQVEGAFAIEFQHLAPILIERINTRLGWRCVGRIVLRQGPVRRRPKGRGRVPPPSPEAMQQASRQTQGIESEQLRDALNRLGARMPAAKTRPDNPPSTQK